MKNLCNKERWPNKKLEPYITWTDPRSGWEYKLIKTWQGDNTAEYARWLVGVKSENTFGSFEYGDEYAANLIPGLVSALARTLTVTYDETIWPQRSDLIKWLLPTLAVARDN